MNESDPGDQLESIAEYVNKTEGVPNRRILLGPPRWQAARETFKEICCKRGVEPSEYGSKYRQSPADVIEAILSGHFEESEYFQTPEERSTAALLKVDQILIEHGIEPSTYEDIYKHRKIDIIYLLLVGQELDLGFWCNPKNRNKYTDSKALFQTMCGERGIDPEAYQLEYRITLADAYKYIHRHYEEILAGDALAIRKVEARVFTKNPDPKRTKEWIFAEAQKCIPPGRTAGLDNV